MLLGFYGSEVNKVVSADFVWCRSKKGIADYKTAHEVVASGDSWVANNHNFRLGFWACCRGFAVCVYVRLGGLTIVFAPKRDCILQMPLAKFSASHVELMLSLGNGSGVLVHSRKEKNATMERADRESRGYLFMTVGYLA